MFRGLSFVLLVLTTSCSMVGMAGRQIGNQYEREGLHAAAAELGADTVHYWAGGESEGDRRALLFTDHADAKRAMVDALLRDLEELRARDTSLIWGRDDPIFPLELGHLLEQRLGPGARLEVIDHARHTPNFEWPKRFDALVLQFLDMPCSCDRRAS